MATTSPDASAPTISGSSRLAKAMPRQPQTSMWFSATARMRSCTSPGPGGGGGGDVLEPQVAVAVEAKGAHQRILPLRGRLGGGSA